MPDHPFNWIVENARRNLFIVVTIFLVCSSWWIMWMGQVLINPVAPSGIVSFELAGNLEASQAILQSWSQEARSAALLIQGFDYLYLIVYPAWFALAAHGLGVALGGIWGRLGVLMSWSVILAAPLDAVENYALIEQLLQGPSDMHASVAWWCAVPKFALVIGASLFVLFGGCAWLLRAVQSR